ncbi:MAG: hypothetical protein M0P73_05845 [Syntrophobacterales bacterium]|jgi:hypothetical protein|nr:hypothetical protein [Syntrophobacterales bacterium]
MTLLITMATKSGIVMGADSKISMWDPKKKVFTSDRSYATKIIAIEDHHMAVSFWGLLDIHLKNNTGTIRRHLIDNIFKNFSASLSKDDDVDTVSEKFRDYLNKTVDFSKLSDFPFGVHMAGYISENGTKKPKIRHVCLSPGDNKDPNQQDISKFKSNDESNNCSEPPYAMVFNGFYYIVNALVNWIRLYHSDIYSMFTPQKMNIGQAISLTKYLINITKGFQTYVRAPKLVGGSVKILAINERGQFSWHNQESNLFK